MLALRRLSSEFCPAIRVLAMKHKPWPAPASIMATRNPQALPAQIPMHRAIREPARVSRPSTSPFMGWMLRCESCVTADAAERIRKAMPGTAGPFQGNRLYKRDGTSEASRLPAANCVKAEALASRNGVRVVLLGKASFGVMDKIGRAQV